MQKTFPVFSGKVFLYPIYRIAMISVSYFPQLDCAMQSS